MTNQIETKIDAINEDIERIANLITYSQSVQKYVFEEDILKRFKMFEFVKDNLNYTLSSNNNIQNIIIVSKNSGVVKSSSDDVVKVYNKINKEYDLDNYNISKPLYTRIYTDEIGKKLYYAYITPIYSFLQQPYDEKVSAACVILLKVDLIQNLIDNVSMPSNSLFILHDKYETVIASSKRENIGEKLDQKTSAFLSSSSVYSSNGNKITYNKKECLYQLTLIKNTEWKIICMVPIAELMKDMKPMLKIGFIINITTTIILLIIGIFIIKSVTNPVSNIIMDMERIGERGNEYRIRIPGDNEIGKISENINLMLERIDTINRSNLAIKENLYTAEIAKKQAELSFLQSQINPHFLYNTLECMKNIGVVYNIPEIIKISTSMARIFRYSIKEHEIVSVREEIESIKDYFSIISIRFMGKYQMIIDLKGEILNHKMPKMILQPIVENSVYHGLETRSREGMVQVTGYYEDQTDGLTNYDTDQSESSNPLFLKNIVFEIRDNGGGMTTEQVDEISRLLHSNNISGYEFYDNKRCIGLLNIDRRLKLKYGEGYGISILSEFGKGTAVKFKIPV